MPPMERLRRPHVAGLLLVGAVGIVWYLHRRRKRRDRMRKIENTRTAFEVIDALARQLLSTDAEGLSYAELLAGLTIIAKSPVAVPSTGRLCADTEVLQDAAHFVRFASGAYGWKLLHDVFFEQSRGLAVSSLLDPGAANVNTLCRHVPGLTLSDVLRADWCGDVFSPSYYVAVDHQTRSVVLALRGTLSPQDVITDAVAESVPFQIGAVSGFVHSGMLQGATMLAVELAPFLCQELLSRPGYNLVITGHSLGAGTASLLAIKLRETTPLKPICYAFAPPCVMSEALAIAAQGCGVRSFVLQGDVVCRLSVGSLEDLKHSAKWVITHTTGPIHRLLVLLKKSEAPWTQMSIFEDLCRLVACDPDRSLTPSFGSNAKLLPPGRIYQLCYPPGAHPKNCWMEESAPRNFSRILVTERMFRDHLPHNYELALESALRSIKLPPISHRDQAAPEVPPADLGPLTDATEAAWTQAAFTAAAPAVIVA